MAQDEGLRRPHPHPFEYTIRRLAAARDCTCPRIHKRLIRKLLFRIPIERHLQSSNPRSLLLWSAIRAAYGKVQGESSRWA